MKKIAFILIFLMLLISHTSKSVAQSFRLGLTASPNLGWFFPEAPSNLNSEGLQLGFTYGLKSEFLLAEFYSFDTGLQIMHLGGKLSYEETRNIEDNGKRSGLTEKDYRLQNIQIPFTLKMKTREIGYNTYFARFGFGASVNRKATGDDRFSSNNLTLEQTNIDLKEDIAFFRIAMIIGLGFEHSLGGNTAIVTGVNFHNGFTNILSKSASVNLPENSERLNAKANFFELSLGILF